ncbi:hypothetical protein ALC56_10182 [Trachymyrmex septentrionalis]|uniref:WW domain binding protein VOPP1 n=1 Tax=Trachymyrmex septentrionalis TaxID=34720 RepID=A0A195F621_9HYME|nr:PREDICTED: uncharacterized protein LOC108751719 isoform X1 [Trachymyrmex septentrionalis]KYN35622.1 hypothetical protein ALC56_10182 [Trachymyrmex septentrionalis]
MARNSKKKLAIFVGTSKCLIYAEAKFCASDIPGEIKYYECSRTEYCCAFGCCVSPGFHFHHLWYYWILVIIMFLVCSGGGWWYRYWLQGRYRAAASAIPTRSSTTRSQSSLRNASCQAQQARITYNSARNTVLLHRMWKGPQRNTAAPAYNGNATTSTHYQNMNVVLNDANCPYYQLYGPPPSYETVIAQTRGKISNPASPESSAARLNLQTANVIPNPSVPQCFFYNCNSPARLVDGNSSQCQSDTANAHQLDSHESVPFAHFSQYCTTNGAVSQNMCVPLEYPEEPIASGGSNFSCNYQNSPHRLPGYPTDRLPNVSDAENVARGYEIPNTEHAILNIDAATSSYRECNPWHENDQSVRVHGKITMQDETRTSQKRCMTTTDMHTLLPKESRSENELKRTFNVIPVMQRNFPRGRTSYGGSLRLPRRHTGIIYQGDGFQNVLPRDSSNASQWSTFNSAQTAASEGASFLERDANSSQSNPSNNVILESFIFENVQLPPSENVEEARGLRAMNRNINFDLESKHKLDRSKSLD